MSTSTSLARRPRVRRNAEQWRSIIHRFESSGQTRDAFCAEHSLALSSFSRWRQRLREERAPSLMSVDDATFIELSPSQGDAPESRPSHWDVELQLGADIVLRLRQRC